MGHGDGQIRKFLGQSLETLMSSQRLLQGRRLLGGDITGVVPALMPALKFVEDGGARPAGLGAKLAPFHTGNGVHFLENFLATLLSGPDQYPYC